MRRNSSLRAIVAHAPPVAAGCEGEPAGVLKKPISQKPAAVSASYWPDEFMLNASRACVGIPGQIAGPYSRTAAPRGPFHRARISESFEAAYARGRCVR